MGNKFIALLAAVLSILIITSSCSKKMHRASSIPAVFYPSPPDTARIQFLTQYAVSSDFVGTQSKFKTFITGPEKVTPLIKPYGLAINDNKIHVVDLGIQGIHIVDLEKKSYDSFIPDGRGKLQLPINCAIDTNGYIYVSDVARKAVVIFNGDGVFVNKIEGEENFKPTDVLILGNSILVTDPNNNRINVYDKSTLQLLSHFPDNSSEGDDDWLYNPLNLTHYGDKIYVTDFGDFKIKQFSETGEHLSSQGGFGRNIGQFVRPKGTAVDSSGNLYVVDAGFENIQVFNDEGALLLFFGGPTASPGGMMLPAEVVIDYDHLDLYEHYVDPAYRLEYLIFVTNQYGDSKVSVYGRVELKSKED